MKLGGTSILHEKSLQHACQELPFGRLAHHVQSSEHDDPLRIETGGIVVGRTGPGSGREPRVAATQRIVIGADAEYKIHAVANSR